MIYLCKYDAQKLIHLNLLQQLVSNSSLTYKTEQEFKKARNEKYIINLKFKKNIFHNVLFLIFELTIPDPKKVKDFDLNDAFQFFYNMIYFPNIVNHEFNHEQYYREREFIKSNLKESIKKISNYSYERFIECFDDIGELKNGLYHQMDRIDTVTPKELYEYYQEIVIHNRPVFLAYGDVTKDEINQLYNQYFPLDNKEIVIDKDYDCYLIPRKETQYIDEKSSYNQSVLYMGYKIQQMKEMDKIYLSLLCNIFQSHEVNLLFKKLRVENNLIYYHHFESYFTKAAFLIEIYTNEESKEKAINVINTMFEELYDKKIIANYLNKILIGIQYDMIRKKDNKYAKLDEIIIKKTKQGKTLDEMYHSFQTLDIDEFIKFLDRIKLDTVYFLRGESNEEK